MSADKSARVENWEVVDNLRSHPAHVRSGSFSRGRGVITCHDCIAQFTGPIAVIVAAWNAHLPAASRADGSLSAPTGKRWTLRALASALEAADAEVEKAYAAMTHWLGKANDADAALASARATLADIADGRWDEKRTDQSQSPSDWARATARAALPEPCEFCGDGPCPNECAAGAGS